MVLQKDHASFRITSRPPVQRILLLFVDEPASGRSLDSIRGQGMEVGFPLQGYLAHKKQPPLGPCSRTMPRVLRES